ncbi:MAG: molybdopterin-binding protein [Vallitaleaceae bacterium]|nr:molybdopterin-binding protein [Vallitaleaceae bacterium]
MKSVKVEDAIGLVLAHDLTKILPGVFKGAAFKKGHIVRSEDIEALKDAGKYHVFVVTLDEGQVHEDDAALRVATAATGGKLLLAEPGEGKVNIKSPVPGLLKVDISALDTINAIGKIALVCLHNNTLVEKDQIVAAAKIIPLTIGREEIEKIEQICQDNRPVFEVKPLYPLKTAVVITGSEVYFGRIIDKFGDPLKEKIRLYGGEPLDLQFAPDDEEFIKRLILESIEMGAQIVIVSGGMAVDSDDVTPKAIEQAATQVITYGIPLLPGAMCMIAYHNDVPIIGVPACAMYNKTTVLDLIYPRLLTQERVEKKELIGLGHGGLCLHCEVCRYPVCPFGK